MRAKQGSRFLLVFKDSFKSCWQDRKDGEEKEEEEKEAAKWSQLSVT